MPKILVNCTTVNCPHFKICVQLPTEYHTVEGRIDILFVGQGGGKDEERLKRPWIGRAGELLRRTIRILRKKRMLGIALSNSVRCRPKNITGSQVKDRKPTQEEIDFCLPYLSRDVLQLKPRALMAMGGNTAEIFGFEGAVWQMRKQTKIHKWGDYTTEVYATYHPSGVLQSGYKYLPDFREDILKVYKLMLQK